ncbi:hypothetical protein RI129_012358 [Pyrocoelia pectoralis]|uniref:Uncharacterized protein n=1 Tax=Pyrocoelia pectoralis TaxID=417401 RepID=A0AAN7ZFU3_9COLE
MYTRNDINKKILAKDARVRGENEYLGQVNKYRDEEYEVYKEKRREFLNAANLYKELNKMAIYTNRVKLDEHSNDILRYNDGCEAEDTKENSLLKKKLNETEKLPQGDQVKNKTNTSVGVCTLEPWFVRYLKLCKFIYAARKIIIYNRLLRNLRILKTWDENSIDALEKLHENPYENVSYSHVFEKFL